MTKNIIDGEAQELSLVDEEKPNAVVPAQEISPMQLLSVAVQNDYPVEKLQKLMDLKERHDAAEAKKAFDKAMAGFRGEAVTIIKSNRAGFDHKSGGGRTEYDYEDLADVVDGAVPALSKWGLSHSWSTEQKDGGVTVTCELTHEMGHSKTTSLHASPDTSGSKNSIQALKSTISYLERITLLSITGLAAKGMDNDGNTPPPGDDPDDFITEEQSNDIDLLLKDIGADRDQFFQWCSDAQSVEVTELRQIRSENYEIVMMTLKQRQKAMNNDTK